MIQRFFRVLMLAIGIAFPHARAGELIVAVSSDLAFCIDDINAEFSRISPGTTTKVIRGASGELYSQIRNGTRCDVFLSADMLYPRELVRAGLAERSSLTAFANGRLTLWAMSPDLNLVRGPRVLNEGSVRLVAIADPSQAPYGRAARSALRYFEIWESVEPKLQLAKDDLEAAELIESGKVDVGILALSLVLSPTLAGKGRYQEIPPESFPAIEHGAVITREGSAKLEARAYLSFITSEDGRRILSRFGYRIPGRPN